jgi:hypothetical protein
MSVLSSLGWPALQFLTTFERETINANKVCDRDLLTQLPPHNEETERSILLTRVHSLTYLRVETSRHIP